MTADEIARRYRHSAVPEPLRTQKAQALARRMHVDWSLVEQAMTAYTAALLKEIDA